MTESSSYCTLRTCLLTCRRAHLLFHTARFAAPLSLTGHMAGQRVGSRSDGSWDALSCLKLNTVHLPLQTCLFET